LSTGLVIATPALRGAGVVVAWPNTKAIKQEKYKTTAENFIFFI